MSNSALIIRIAGTTQTDIDAVKAAVKEKYGQNAEVFKYDVDGKTCFLRTVDRDTYSIAASKVATSPAKFNETIINAIWLGGDEELRTDDRYYFALIDFVEEFMDKKKGQLQKL